MKTLMTFAFLAALTLNAGTASATAHLKFVINEESVEVRDVAWVQFRGGDPASGLGAAFGDYLLFSDRPGLCARAKAWRVAANERAGSITLLQGNDGVLVARTHTLLNGSDQVRIDTPSVWFTTSGKDCAIATGSQIEVSFGEVTITQVDEDRVKGHVYVGDKMGKSYAAGGFDAAICHISEINQALCEESPY